MNEKNSKTEKPPSPEYRTFTEALSLALSASKAEVQKRVDRMKFEKVSRYKRWKYVPAKPQP